MSTQTYFYIFLALFAVSLIISIIELLKSPYTTTRKIMWFLLCLVMPILGTIVFHMYRKGNPEG